MAKDNKHDQGKPIAGALVDFKRTLRALSVPSMCQHYIGIEYAVAKSFEACWLNNDDPVLLAYYAIQLMPVEPDLECPTFIGQFAQHLLEIASLMEFGQRKYERSSWLEVPDGFNRYSDAMMRHYLQSFYELKDRESGYYHLTCVAWNAMCRCELFLRGRA